LKIKIISFIFLLVFALFAYLQINDPDPLLWFTVYAIVAVLSGMRVFEVYDKRLFLVTFVLLTLMSLFYFASFLEYLSLPDKNEIVGEMVYKKSYIEETREFLGLWIAAAALFYLYRKS